jgi:phenylacetate-CoA ligase
MSARPALNPDILSAEKLARDELEARQWAKFRLRLEQWYATNRFYRRHLDQAGVTPDSISSRDDLRRIPTITKADLIADQLAEPPFGRRLGVPAEAVARIAMTGGTSGGEKVVQPLSRADADMCAQHLGITYRWSGLRDTDIAAFNVGFSNHSGGWAFYAGAQVVGRAPYVIGHEGFKERIALMRRFGVNGLFATPSALNGLTVVCHELGHSPRELFPDLRYILLGAEAYPLEFALRMEDEWGARAHENYGSTESHAGNCASTCHLGAAPDGARGLMHFFESNFLLEVVDRDTGNPVEPGEPGVFVITTLENEASPMLRYDSQDRVVWYPHHACSCGLAFDGIEAGSVGRWDDMIKIKNTNVWPGQIDEIVFAFPDVVEYQGELYIGDRGRDEARIRVAFDGEPARDPTRTDAIASSLRSRLEVRFDVVEVPAADLPRFTTAEKKARRWRDLRHEQLARGQAS